MRRLKLRQERFCQKFVECANATVAAKVAGYAPASARNAGYRLLRQPRIAKRIAEIQSEMARAHCYDLDILLGKLETVYRCAIDGHHFSTAARAVELQAKLGASLLNAAATRTRVVAQDTPSPPSSSRRSRQIG